LQPRKFWLKRLKRNTRARDLITDPGQHGAVLKARGVEFVQDPKKEIWGTSAIFKDPDGNQYVLSSR